MFLIKKNRLNFLVKIAPYICQLDKWFDDKIDFCEGPFPKKSRFWVPIFSTRGADDATYGHLMFRHLDLDFRSTCR